MPPMNERVAAMVRATIAKNPQVDNAELRATLADLFELAGVPVVMLPHGRAALEYLAEAPPPALIITDLMMPVMTGWELCARLRSDTRFADVPVAVMSALTEAHAARHQLVLAAYLQKPVDPCRLLALVRAYCAH